MGVVFAVTIAVGGWRESVLLLEELDEVRGVREVAFDSDLRYGFVGGDQQQA